MTLRKKTKQVELRIEYHPTMQMHNNKFDCCKE